MIAWAFYYATLMTAKALSTGKDTVEVLQFRDENSPRKVSTESLTRQEPGRKNALLDTCIGVWANWANPFMLTAVLYQRNGNYYVEGYSGLPTAAVADSTSGRKIIQIEKEEQSTSYAAVLF